ncbi:MAG: hypothetical protein KQH63_20985 [Desulfobulbaceae bacterium]|nr:hypothetical protein [Desulfobulbaceae bacterium]
MKKMVFLAGFLLFYYAGVHAVHSGVNQRRPLPFEYGRVVLDNASSTSGRAPVVFDHWLHRARFTCRLCHEDLEFAMQAGATGIRAADNEEGYYCGACHNGKQAFSSCMTTDAPASDTKCAPCHSGGRKVKKKHSFREFAHNLPRGRFGNGINWEEAEKAGKITLQDFIKGISAKNNFAFKNKDFKVGARFEGFPDILFSHRKHSVWNGCGGCHPEIFAVQKGATHFTMADIYKGKYCGVCHGKVAFPVIDCQRCHVKDVQQ